MPNDPIDKPSALDYLRDSYVARLSGDTARAIRYAETAVAIMLRERPQELILNLKKPVADVQTVAA